MSWLAAARNLVLEILAASASPLARASAALSRVSSSVRSLHAPLQRLVGALQRFGRFDARRDVGEGGDDAAVRHAVGAHLDDHAGLGEALEERLAAGDVALDLRLHEIVDRSGATSLRRPLKRRMSASPLPTRIRLGGRSRISPNCRFQQINCRSLSNTAMPWRTWSSAVCRISRLYWIAALASSSSFKRRLGRDRALAQQQRQHQPRRCRADGRGEDMFGMAHQPEIGLVLGLEADAVRGGKALEGAARALLAEIARDRGGQFLDRHRGAPEPEARRDRRQIGRHEQRWPAAARSARARAAARSRCSR